MLYYQHFENKLFHPFLMVRITIVVNKKEDCVYLHLWAILSALSLLYSIA